ncbi:hypothetical protein [Dactylosporangium sp. CA-139066]|uniref:hypothetical protein n=1 Tax=Dactylosporangium sp. CA-139066 TaxID=3239930 RepID=UPI003D8F580E
MRIVLTWQPASGPEQTVYVEDATDRDAQVVEAAFEHRDTEAESVITLQNVGLRENDPQRGEFMFRVGRLRRFEVQR